MEGGTALSDLITNITSVVTGITTMFGNVATALISNQVFQLMLGVIIFTILVGIAIGMAKGIKSRRGRRR